MFSTNLKLLLSVFLIAFVQSSAQQISPCTTNICENGVCGNFTGVVNCTCVSGFTGVVCQTPVDFCASERDPCQNGSNCTLIQPGTGEYTCACESGWIGKNCQFETTFSEFPSTFVININVGGSTTSSYNNSFLNYLTQFNSSNGILTVNSDDNSIVDFTNGVGAIHKPAILMNTTVISVHLNDKAESAAYFLSILTEKSKIVPIDVNGTLREDWKVVSLVDLPITETLFYPRESSLLLMPRLPLCSLENGCDGFAFYPGVMKQLYPQNDFAGLLFDLHYMIQANKPTSVDFIEAELDPTDFGLSLDNTKGYSHVKLFVSSQWYSNFTGSSTLNGSSLFPGGAIAGIVIGLVSACLLIAIYYYQRNKKQIITSRSRFRRTPGIAMS